MKLVFVYRNGSRFTASGVEEINCETDNGKLAFICYSSFREINPDVLQSAIAGMFPQAPDDGIFCTVNPEDTLALVEVNYIVDVNRSQLSYVILVKQPSDFEATNELEAVVSKTYQVVPVLDNPTIDAITDGLKVMM